MTGSWMITSALRWSGWAAGRAMPASEHHAHQHAVTRRIDGAEQLGLIGEAAVEVAHVAGFGRLVVLVEGHALAEGIVGGDEAAGVDVGQRPVQVSAIALLVG